MSAQDRHSQDVPVMIVGAFGLAVSPVATLLAVVLSFVRRRWPDQFLRIALFGAVACVLLAIPAIAQAREAWAAFSDVGLIRGPGRALDAAWSHTWRWWVLSLPSAPLLTFLIDAVRPASVEERERTRQRQVQRRHDRIRRRAARRSERHSSRPWRDDVVRRKDEFALVLGAKIAGERILWETWRGQVALPLNWLRHHALVIGPSGSGKTETLLRLAYGTALAGGWRIFYLDAKGDVAGRERFRSLMEFTGCRVNCFPAQRMDAWRGDGAAIYNRLIELVPYAREGDGAYYRDIAKRILWLACTGAGEPPRSSADLLRRLHPSEMRALAADSGDPDVVGERELAGVLLRYRAFFDALAGKLDGGFAFEDSGCAHTMLDGLHLKEEAQGLARLLVEDFSHFAAVRKESKQPVLLIVDELSAIAESARLVDLVERLRSFGVAVVLAPQVEAGMGGEATAERIVQNVETVFLHALKRPESIAALAGTRREIESSFQHEEGVATGVGSGRPQHVFKVDPNEVRALHPGECFVIRGGRYVRIQIARAPRAPSAGPAMPSRLPRVRPQTVEDERATPPLRL